jgi:hypothetical protein
MPGFSCWDIFLRYRTEPKLVIPVAMNQKFLQMCLKKESNELEWEDSVQNVTHPCVVNGVANFKAEF